MLVALSIKNFKSIREAHVRFGPCTCFIGHNGVGKSNLFDAIHFLSALTERDISDAATEVRRTSDGGYSPLDLVFGRHPDRRIELSADMVVPPQVRTTSASRQSRARRCSLTVSGCGTSRRRTAFSWSTRV